MDEGNAAQVLSVSVDGEGWRRTRSLGEAGPEDKVFVLDPAGRMVFGDGRHGRRPPGGALVTVAYRDGDAGNAQVSVTTRWPPPERSYLLSLSSAGIRIGATAGVERFAGVKRLSYFEGQLLGAADFRDEQQYHVARRHLHNRALHGSGVVSGLSATVSVDGSSPSVVVQPGLALDPQGRELELAAPVTVPIGSAGGPLYVLCEYAERETDPVPSPSAGGGTAEGGTVASRIEEGASIRLSPDAATRDGVALARLVTDSAGWRVDAAFGPSRCR